jgi:putative endonuclease
VLDRFRNFLNHFREQPSASLQKTRGDLGERHAACFLKKEKGFKVLAQNWRSGRDELDLICRDGSVFVCVEVKTRSESARVPGYYSVNARKKQALLRACRAYLRNLSQRPNTLRFDVVEVRLGNTGEVVRILHYPNVPLFPKHF